MTSHHVTMKAPVWRKNSSSTSSWNISSLDCRLGCERMSFSACALSLSARQEMCYQVPVLATLWGWRSILCLEYLAKSTQVLVQCWKAQLGIICEQEANHYKLLVGSRIWRHTSDHLPPCINEGTSLTGKRMQWFFDFLLKHLKLRLSVWLGKAELLSWHSLCRAAGNVLPGTSLSNAVRMGKHTVLEIFSKRHSSAGAMLKGTAGHNMWARANYYQADQRRPPTMHQSGERIVLRLPAETSQALIVGLVGTGWASQLALSLQGKKCATRYQS